MRTATHIAPNSGPAALAKIDQRTREARLMREARAELTAHVGGKPSAVQRALIEQLVQLRLRLCVMDRAFAESSTQTDHDSRMYLAWSNSYARGLRQLGLQAAAEKPPSFYDVMATWQPLPAPAAAAEPSQAVQRPSRSSAPTAPAEEPVAA